MCASDMYRHWPVRYNTNKLAMVATCRGIPPMMLHFAASLGEGTEFICYRREIGTIQFSRAAGFNRKDFGRESDGSDSCTQMFYAHWHCQSYEHSEPLEHTSSQVQLEALRDPVLSCRTVPVLYRWWTRLGSTIRSCISCGCWLCVGLCLSSPCSGQEESVCVCQATKEVCDVLSRTLLQVVVVYAERSPAD